MIKLTDYVIKYLANAGTKNVFMISGGGAMHLVDSVGKEKRISYLCPHHEQAAAIAAEGYSRTSGKMGVVVVTSGPGGTNTLTGVIGQWLDSVPCLYLSGQVKFETTIESAPDIKLRQLGDQEINIVNIVKPVTKYAVFVKDPKTIRYHLEKAIYLATHGRPGPVWLDIPLDVQAAMIDPKKLKGYFPSKDVIVPDGKILKKKVKAALAVIKRSKRPIILAGQGIRISKAQALFLKLAERLDIPVLTSFCGFDLIPSGHRLFAGRPGTLGTRAGNFALQNSDCIICIGTRNNIRQISYNWEVFGREAKKIVVDIDPAELKKPTVRPDIVINADAKDFLTELEAQSKKIVLSGYKEWVDWCREKVSRYPVVLPEYRRRNKPVNPYLFADALTDLMKKGAVAVTGDGTACVSMFQAGKVKSGQRIFWNSGCASMGYDLSAAIGACVANKKRPVVCIAGDGSLQMNLQELQTVIGNKLPIKIFVLNNKGYISIRQTQDSFFNGRHVGCDPKSGVTFPDILKVAKAYGFHVEKLDNHAKMRNVIGRVLSRKGPVVCEVLLDPGQKFSPRVSSKKLPDGRMISKPLEDMFPFLDRDEFLENMIVGPLKEE